MASRPRSQAFSVVRAAVRMRMLADRLKEVDPEIPALTGDLHTACMHRITTATSRHAHAGQEAPDELSQPLLDRINMARASLRSSSGRPDGDAGVRKTHWFIKDLRAFAALVTESWLNMLLIAVPLGIAAGWCGWGSKWTFSLNFLALIPLALILGDVTEDLALRFGDVIGGLLNATFGNVVEIIISIAALEKGLFTVVATSLLGSILSNLLLVLGFCFLCGGFSHRIQTFNATSNRTGSSLLFLAAVGIAVPTCAAHIIKDEGIRSDWILNISRGTAMVLLVTYFCYLYFQLYSHKDLFMEQDEEEEGNIVRVVEEPVLSTPSALLALAVITLAVAMHSEYLTGSLEEVSKQTGIGEAFLGFIVLPIAGNACEHLTAVVVAMKDKMDLSLGIAIGSSLQIALFAIPFTVLVGWATAKDFSLDFDLFSVIALLLAVIHSNFVTADANSHWLLGVTLIAVYILVALTFFYR